MTSIIESEKVMARSKLLEDDCLNQKKIHFYYMCIEKYDCPYDESGNSKIGLIKMLILFAYVLTNFSCKDLEACCEEKSTEVTEVFMDRLIQLFNRKQNKSTNADLKTFSKELKIAFAAFNVYKALKSEKLVNFLKEFIIKIEEKYANNYVELNVPKNKKNDIYYLEFLRSKFTENILQHFKINEVSMYRLVFDLLYDQAHKNEDNHRENPEIKTAEINNEDTKQIYKDYMLESDALQDIMNFISVFCTKYCSIDPWISFVEYLNPYISDELEQKFKIFIEKFKDKAILDEKASISDILRSDKKTIDQLIRRCKQQYIIVDQFLSEIINIESENRIQDKYTLLNKKYSMLLKDFHKESDDLCTKFHENPYYENVDKVTPPLFSIENFDKILELIKLNIAATKDIFLYKEEFENAERRDMFYYREEIKLLRNSVYKMSIHCISYIFQSILDDKNKNFYNIVDILLVFYKQKNITNKALSKLIETACESLEELKRVFGIRKYDNERIDSDLVIFEIFLCFYHKYPKTELVNTNVIHNEDKNRYDLTGLIYILLEV